MKLVNEDVNEKVYFLFLLKCIKKHSPFCFDFFGKTDNDVFKI